MIPYLLLLAGLNQNQALPPVSAAHDYARLRDGINPPKLLHSTDPQYTPQALAARIEGTVVLHAIVDVQGNVAYVSVLSPLPDGLDERALAAVKHWKYAPAVMDGELIPALTTIDVVFRAPYRPPDPIEDSRRRTFQRIADRVTPTPEEVKQIKDLASHGMPHALGLLGQWNLLGSGVPQNTAEGLSDLQKAALQGDPRSLFFLGSAEITGRLVPKNEQQGWQYVHQAAFLGDADAQGKMGDKEESAKNRSEAKHYFRLCAATAHPACEFRLGRLLVTGTDTNPDDFSEGVAWLDLSKNRGNKDAARLYETASAKLSSIQIDWVRRLEPHLELKDYKGF